MITDVMEFNGDHSTLTICLPQRLDIHSTATYWTEALNVQAREKPTRLIIDASHMNYCDGAGITLLIELYRQQQAEQASVEFKQLKKRFEHMFSTLIKAPTAERGSPPVLSFVQRLGKGSAQFLTDVKSNITFMGELGYHLLKQIAHPTRLRWREFFRHLETIGPYALPIAALLGFILGVILSFQAMMSLKRYGAEIFAVNLVNISLTRELAPLMTAIILAGRTASAFAAELATMKINRELDALSTMGLASIPFLIVPRVLAAVIMTPLLSLYVIFFGYIGCLCVTLPEIHSVTIFMNQLTTSFKMTDFMGGCVKAFVFGILISMIGCIHGLRAARHAMAVGESTTQAVVSSIIMLGIIDGLLTFIYYVLGV